MKKGISLIVLVITIIIMIIIAGAIILSLNSSNVTGRAKLSTLSSDRANYKAQYAVAYANAMAALDADGQDVTVNRAFQLAIGESFTSFKNASNTVALGADAMDGWVIATSANTALGLSANEYATKRVGQTTWTLTQGGEVYAVVSEAGAYGLQTTDLATGSYYWITGASN